MNKVRDKTLIAIPAYNESKYIRDVLKSVCEYADYVLVIDDGSTDGTDAILRHTQGIDVITHSQNAGYGQTLIDAFNFAAERGFEWIITMDCDLQHEPACLPRFYERIEMGTADIISGSRYFDSFGTRPLNVPNDRYMINKKITSFLNKMLNLNLTDSFCGFKAYRVRSVKKLPLTEKGYAFPLQLWLQAYRADLVIEEIPVPLIYVDAKRCFGGELDNPEIRLNQYMEVIYRELKKQ